MISASLPHAPTLAIPHSRAAAPCPLSDALSAFLCYPCEQLAPDLGLMAPHGNKGNRSSSTSAYSTGGFGLSAFGSPPVAPPSTNGLFGSTVQSPAPAATDASLQKPTRSALEYSLTSGVFVDCQFYLYSCRGSDGTAHTPLAIYANSDVLKQTTEHFESLLSGGFLESLKDRRPGCRTRISISEYEYESDSDLDDDEVDMPHSSQKVLSSTETDDSSMASSRSVTEGPSRAVNTKKDASVATEPVTEPQVLEPSPSMKADVEAEHSQASSADTPEDFVNRTGTSSPQLEPGVRKDDIHPFSEEVPVRHAMVLPDIAFRTFRAFVFYAYTGEIKFKTLASLRNISETRDLAADTRLACSPKSMYRLADKYGFFLFF
ncbi:hypothetical protein BV20DRAFT_1118983 [Pilatotrama ljubarskyi]|nr:hypothetical protein BV20DRAFT_1118983 [Pilatotrama ljubarskyi]